MKNFRVDIIESEKGWGQKIEETKYFETLEEAQSFVEKFNKNLPKDKVPDYYVIAKDPVKI